MASDRNIPFSAGGDILASPVSRADTKANLAAVVPSAGEFNLATDARELYVGDGSTTNGNDATIALPLFKFATFQAQGSGADHVLFSLPAPDSTGGNDGSAYVVEVKLFAMDAPDGTLGLKEFRVIVFNAGVTSQVEVVTTGDFQFSVSFNVVSHNLRCVVNDQGGDSSRIDAHYRQTFIKVN